MNKNCFVGITALTLVLFVLLSVNGCAPKIQAQNLMEGITAKDMAGTDTPPEYSVNVTQFAVRLFQAAMEDGKNTLISPISVMCALGMTAGGARGNTLAQMESALGMKIPELNGYLHNYMEKLPQTDKYKLNLANSIWFTDDARFTVNQDFLQNNADYYGADIYRAPFDDSTLADINHWVKAKTAERIPEILDEIPKEAVMYLVNALSFEAEWYTIYEKDQVHNGKFTLADGTEQTAEFMYNEEADYLEDAGATGFIKYYKERKYAFAALLPDKGKSVSEYIATLDGAHLNEILANPQQTAVGVSIPKFDAEYSAEMSELLRSMGMVDAFANTADFTGIGSSTAGNIYISRILHKAFISVGEKGTQAGAATVVEAVDEAAPFVAKNVYLDRPFVYMLIDCETNIPFFIGTMENITG